MRSLKRSFAQEMRARRRDRNRSETQRQYDQADERFRFCDFFRVDGLKNRLQKGTQSIVRIEFLGE